jgi:hypothetical protein
MAEADALVALMERIPEKGISTIPNPRCCCGKTDCAYLRHNCTALDDLEQEVRTAAQLGQVCTVLVSLYDPPRASSEPRSRRDSRGAAAHLLARWTGRFTRVGRKTLPAKD